MLFQRLSLELNSFFPAKQYYKALIINLKSKEQIQSWL